MADATETVFIGLTLPKSWVEAIDKKTSVLKSRQDVIREMLEPKIKELLEA